MRAMERRQLMDPSAAAGQRPRSPARAPPRSLLHPAMAPAVAAVPPQPSPRRGAVTATAAPPQRLQQPPGGASGSSESAAMELLHAKEQEVAALRESALRALEQQVRWATAHAACSKSVARNKPELRVSAIARRRGLRRSLSYRISADAFQTRSRRQLAESQRAGAALARQLEELKSDFAYNLQLLAQRDAELERYDANVGQLEAEAAAKAEAVLQLRGALAQAQCGERRLCLLRCC